MKPYVQILHHHPPISWTFRSHSLPSFDGTSFNRLPQFLLSCMIFITDTYVHIYSSNSTHANISSINFSSNNLDHFIPFLENIKQKYYHFCYLQLVWNWQWVNSEVLKYFFSIIFFFFLHAWWRFLLYSILKCVKYPRLVMTMKLQAVITKYFWVGAGPTL